LAGKENILILKRLSKRPGDGIDAIRSLVTGQLGVDLRAILML